MKLGLVLAGGGGKGAYQMGAWKAFREYNIKFDAISGTSIGALNGLLISMDQYELANKMWLSVEDRLNEQMDQTVTGLSEEKMYLLEQSFKDPSILRSLAEQPGLMDSTQMKKQMMQIVEQYPIKKNIYVSAVNAGTIECEYFQLEGTTTEETVNKAFASASLPVIFDSVNIYGEEYFDGGILDNVPIAPLMAEECDLIFVVLLKSSNVQQLKTNGKTPIIPFIPSKDLGNFGEGTMNFKREDVIAKKELGYQDTIKTLSKLHNLFK